MKILGLPSLCVLVLGLLTACGDESSTGVTGSTGATAPRAVTFRSHLGGSLADDPTVQPGERLQVLPAPDERCLERRPVLVTLPATTPYGGPDVQYFLRGYAIGRLTVPNRQFM